MAESYSIWSFVDVIVSLGLYIYYFQILSLGGNADVSDDAALLLGDVLPTGLRFFSLVCGYSPTCMVPSTGAASFTLVPAPPGFSSVSCHRRLRH